MAARPRLVTLLRHGEVEWPPHAFLGALDPPLSARGRAAMREMFSAIDDPPITAIVTSPLARCREFAAALAAERALPLGVARGLAEMRFGAWEGLTVEEVLEREPALIKSFQADPSRAKPPDGEPYGEFLARVGAALESVAKTGEAHTLVVTHAGVIRAMLAIALCLAPAALSRIALPPAGTCRLSLLEDAPPCVLALNFAMVER